jgi:hypothetical protein
MSQLDALYAQAHDLTLHVDQRLAAALKFIELEHCPYDCDNCHSDECPCDRSGCAGNS